MSDHRDAETANTACTHGESLWGRCTNCGMTWEQQAVANVSAEGHDIRVTAHGGEVIVSCATCEDEIGASLRTIRLAEIQVCVDLHKNGSGEADRD